MAIEVIRPGPLTTVQDLGRAGHAAEGVPECGACDKLGYALATVMAGNASPVAALECTWTGPALRFTEDAVAAVYGARPTLNGRPARACFPIWARPGDVLDVGPADGLRAYVAVYGGIDVPEALGSRSTDLCCRIGGYQGRALRAGDCLAVPSTDAQTVFPRLYRRAKRVRIPTPWDDPGRRVRVVPGPQAFAPESMRTFLTEDYVVSTASDRMGMRLTGAPVVLKGGTDILSDAISEGSVQVPADGQPVILLADHQTLGGYAKIATVAPTDLPLLAQLRPGQAVRFVAVNWREAVALYRRDAARLAALIEEMGRDDDQRGHQFRPGRELWRLYGGHGRGGDPLRHLRQRRLRISRR